MQQVRTEIGRRLKEYYDTGPRPMPDRLADLVWQIEHPNGRCEEGSVMSKPDEYRAHAQECERMAAISGNPNEKAALLQMAQQWLRMIPKIEPAKSDLPDADGPA
jgi:hypothetical protein